MSSSRRWVTFTHSFLTIAQAAFALLFIRLDLLPLALAAALAGKWRVVSLHGYRFWRNLRTNSCDIIVIVASVLSMDFYREQPGLLMGYSLFLVLWLLIIKPADSRGAIALQAASCQFLGLSVLWLYGLEQGVPGSFVILGAAAVTYTAARHLCQAIFSDGTAERRILPIVWTAVITQLAWLSWLWAITYRLPGGVLIPQIALLATTLGFFAAANFFSKSASRRLSSGFIWQQATFCLIIVLAMIVMTSWITT